MKQTYELLTEILFKCADRLSIRNTIVNMAVIFKFGLTYL